MPDPNRLLLIRLLYCDPFVDDDTEAADDDPGKTELALVVVERIDCAPVREGEAEILELPSPDSAILNVDPRFPSPFTLFVCLPCDEGGV